MNSHIKICLLIPIFFIFILSFITNYHINGGNTKKNKEKGSNQDKPIGTNPEISRIAGSQGILLINESNYLSIKVFEILIPDSNILIKFSFADNYLSINNKIYKLYGEPMETYNFSNSNVFNPRIFSLEPDIIQFEVKEMNHKHWNVFLTKDKSITGLITTDTNLFTFENWETHFYRTMISYDEHNPLREFPKETSKIINIENPDMLFLIKEIKGDWVRIECAELCGQMCNDKIQGWIRWNDGSKIILQMGYSC